MLEGQGDGNPPPQKSPSPSTPPCTRLPPVESRETVICKITRVTGWRLVDESDDLYESTTVDREQPLNLPKDLHVIPKHPQALTTLSTSLALRPPTKRPTSPLLPPPKKRRLLVTAQAAEIASLKPERSKDQFYHQPQTAEEELEMGNIMWASGSVPSVPGDDAQITPSTTANADDLQDAPLIGVPDQTGFTLYQDEETETGRQFDDEGYRSYTLSPTSDGKELTEDEQQEQLIKTLTALQRNNIQLFRPSPSVDRLGSSNSEDQDEDIEEASQWMLRDQEAGAERSRILREKALERRGLLTSSDNPITLSLERDDISMHSGEHSDYHDPLSEPNPGDNYQASNAEDLLDIAQSHCTTIRQPAMPKVRDTLKSHRHRNHPNAVDAASRTAADQYRTQGRHLSLEDAPPTPVHNTDFERGEQRLRELSRVPPGAKALTGNSVSSPNLNNQFIGDDLSPRPRRVDEHKSSADLAACSLPARTESPCENASPPVGSDDCRDSQRTPRLPLSGLDMLAAKKGTALEKSKYLNQGEEESAPPPKQTGSHRSKPGLTLPANFSRYDEEAQAIIVKHETMKERRRDLEVIDFSIRSCGHLRSLGRFTHTEEKELDEVRRFIKLVLEEGKCGKPRRTRIMNIRDNNKRRAIRFEEPDEETIRQWSMRIFGQNRLNQLKEELEQIADQVAELGALRNTLKRHHHSSSHRYKKVSKSAKKQVRFSTPVEGQDTDISPFSNINRQRPKSTCASENRRQAQYDHQDRLRQRFKDRLKLFGAPAETRASGIPEQSLEADEQRVHRGSDDDDEDESEEDEGAEWVYGAGRDSFGASLTGPASFPAPQNVDMEMFQEMTEINRQEDARQKENSTHASQRLDTLPTSGSQRFDPELLKQMQLKKGGEGDTSDLVQTTAIAAAATATGDSDISSDPGDLADGADDEGDEDEDEDEDDEEDRQVFKYTVLGTFAGVDIYKDADEYTFKTTYKLTSAKKQVSAIIESVLREFPPEDGAEEGHWSLSAECRQGLIEQHLMVGKDANVEARVWIKKQLVDLNRKAFWSAKRQNIVKRTVLFAVEWQKTIAPVIGVEANPPPSSPPTAEDDTDSLFGGDDGRNKEPPRPAAPVTTNIHSQDMMYFSTSILANRHAKDLYMAWHATFLPGVQNEGYRRLEGEAMERDLESLGGWGLWSREESFERVDGDGDDDGKGEVEGEDLAGPTTDERKNKARGLGRVQEKFKVWVRRIEVLGPGN